MRYDFGEPSERQKRNRRWIATHPVHLGIALAVFFGAMLGAIGWLGSSGRGAVLWGTGGVLMGALLGVGFSFEYDDENQTRGRQVVMVSGLVAVVILATILALT